MTEPSPTVVLAPLGPATPGRVASWLSMAEANQDVVDTTAAVNANLRRWISVPADDQPWPADHVQGAVQLAGRLYRRRNSPAGVETFGTEGAAYVQKYDPDIAQLLGLGPYSSLAVG